MFVTFSTRNGSAALPIRAITAIVSRDEGCLIHYGYGVDASAIHSSEQVGTIVERINTIGKEAAPCG